MLTHCMRNLLVALAILVPTVTASAAKPDEERKELEQQVAKATKILRAESMGSKLDRREYFEPMLAGETVADEVYWQAGYVKQDNRWVAYDGISFTTETQETLKEYAEHRAKFWGNDEEHLQIAQWCAEKGLYEQARAHLMAVLLNHPGDPRLRQALGYRRIAGKWISASEYESRERAHLRLQDNLRAWTPRVTRIRDGLLSGNALRQRQAQTELSKITDATSVPALALILLGDSKLCSQKCVEQLAAINHRSATIALCGAALNSRWNSIADMAVTELKLRSAEDYLPSLLASTGTNHRTIFQWHLDDPYVNDHGFLAIFSINRSVENFTHIDQRVSQHGLQFNLISNDPNFASKVKNPIRGPARVIGDLSPAERNNFVLYLWNNNTSQDVPAILDSALSELKSAEQQEIADREHCDKVVTLLNRTIEDSEFRTIEDVWSWWNRKMEFGIERERLVQQREVFEVAEEEYTFPVLSCFAKGTPVYSEGGIRPIESIKIGDRVLAKNVDTGELSYRPVIRTTYREPDLQLVRITIGEETITATGGHRFWVSGLGWKKARDLVSGHRVHTVTGTANVDRVEEVALEPVYNLLVDDFHTYFVGESMLLCHDYSLASPTDALVPGLVD